MIAASDPQEFVPSGRQQTLRHPGPGAQHAAAQQRARPWEDVLLDKFEMVSLKEKESEWWILRKSSLIEAPKNIVASSDNNCTHKSSAPPKPNKSHYSGSFFDESYSFKSCEASCKEVKPPSECTTSRLSSKHVTGDHSAIKNNADAYFTNEERIAYMEDELYVKGQTLIWSRGLFNCDNLDNGRKTMCAYTCPLPIKQAVWCTFFCEHPTYDNDTYAYNEDQSPKGVPMPAICLIDSHNIRTFAVKGEDFVTPLPFQINKIWNTKYGILIEKEIQNVENQFYDNRASLYSLAYPLDEVCPVVVSNGAHVHILNNNSFKIVFISENPSICLVYDAQTKQHSAYRIRKVTNSEKLEIANKMNSTYASSVAMSSRLKNRLSVWDNSKSLNCVSIPSPMNSRPGSVASFCNTYQSRSHSSMATISRCHSPAVSTGGSPWLQRISRLSASGQCGTSNCVSMSQSYFDSSKLMTHLHANPTVCFEYLWTDHCSAPDENLSSPSPKVFLIDDCVGQWYICYIISSKLQLAMVRVDISNESNITFGLYHTIPAKDAVPIPSIHMVAILECNGNVSLYSGIEPVGKLHIGGTLVQHVPSPFVKRNFTHFHSPFPRRSSLLPHCKPGDAKFDEHLLSPVLPEYSGLNSKNKNLLHLNFHPETNSPKAVLNGLQDPIENRITLRYSDGTYYRITLPPITSQPLVENCITALKQCVMRDTASVILTKWYATRNALGSQEMNLEQEWKIFEALLFELLGYVEQSSSSPDECPVTPSSNPKRQKQSLGGNDDDWEFMSSKYDETTNHFFKQIIEVKPSLTNSTKSSSVTRININSILFPHIRLIHYSLHLLYEDLKLNMLRSDDVQLLGPFLNRLSSDLGLDQYSIHYWKDFPDSCDTKRTNYIGAKEAKHIHTYSFIDEKPFSIMEFIHELVQGNIHQMRPYPYIKNINGRSKDIIQICGVITLEVCKDLRVEALVKTVDLSHSMYDHLNAEEEFLTLQDRSPSHQATLLMTQKCMTVHDLDLLPAGIYLLLYGALWKCRNNPPLDLPAEAYSLLWRDELAAQARKMNEGAFKDNSRENGSWNIPQNLGSNSEAIEGDQLDGMEDIENPLMKLRFPDDMRVLEARKMLQSSKPVSVVLAQRPGVSDHDFIEEQEKHLYAICTRTMALSTGRGMFTLRTSTPVITEPLQTPALCLTGKVPPHGASVELHHIDTPSNMNLWPLFHNGVANGLRIMPNAHNIDNTWIVFNKPKDSVEQQMEHAGFLMALGLNGHLKSLDLLNTYKYLVKLQEMTSIAILLGLSAAYRGTAHFGMTKTLSVHVEALLPPTSMELDVHQNVQVAGLLGIGLVYEGSCHRHITEVLLSEIGRPPGPEMENSVDRESYSLAAGLALGLVTLKQGSATLGLSDLNVPDRLYYYMMGGNRRTVTGAQKDKYKVPSFQIREGTAVNLDVTAPGATIALGLMFFGSGNKAVADWMAPPETQYMLDFVRPDFLMLRMLSRALIMLDDIKPTKKWVEDQVPDTIRPHCMIKPVPNSDIDYEAMNQAYCNIVTGACFALGLKYAGTADENAFQTLLHFCHSFTNLTVKSIAELAGKPTIETCLNVLILSTSMVMAGTGNLDVMRLVRFLRRRVGVASTAVVTYGSHLALHMALGLLFLGGGRYTLSNSPANIAALICALYPKFPTHSNDNRYHLQAFRHLYVLAVEPRLFIPRDINSGKQCYANLRIVKIDGGTMNLKAPGIVPDLNTLRKVEVCDERYWPIVFERGRNWDQLMNILSSSGCIEIKQRAGCLSYVVDKLGLHSQLAKTLTESEIVPWDPPSSSIISFTQDRAIKYFCDHFLTSEDIRCRREESKMKRMFTKITYDAVVKDKLIVLQVFAFLSKMMHEIELTPNTRALWQFKLIVAQILQKPLSSHLISVEVMIALEQQLITVLEKWQRTLSESLKAYFAGSGMDPNKSIQIKLAPYVIYYGIPYTSEGIGGDFLEVLFRLSSKLPARSIEKLLQIHSVCETNYF